MTLTDRDRKILLAVVPVLLVGVYWFLLLAPKREEARTAADTLAAEQQRLADAESRASTLNAAKSTFASDYEAVVRLGKAVPTSVDMPSLLVQLEQAASGTGIVFEKVTPGERSAAEALAAPAPGSAPASGPGQAVQSAEEVAAAASAPPPTSDQAAAGGAAPAPAPAPGAPQAATPAPAGAGGLESVPLDFSFRGSFFELADFFHRLKRFVYVDGEKVRVRGRLMTIDSVAYTTDAESFPDLTAQVKATVYLTAREEGATAGATPAGPAPSAAPPPDTSTASTGDGAAAPTATATP